ncbi:TetR family transcriptional regulator [Actinomadura chokoriensis]|uniref:TetR family transcriptional regulator n=1 Tax=Actinomadura chokoriensis TaxID=454156 RepID=A0ABV4QY80_9ACTN
MSAVPAGDPSGHPPGRAPAEEPALAGLRERKKQRTRLALIDAALDLFLAKGYEATTIDEIVAAVEVSQRTFFRYFATKEDVVTSFLTEHDQVLGEALATRPPGERPFTALFESLRVVLRTIAEGDPAEGARFRRVRKIVESTPSLMAAQMARYAESTECLAAEIARRENVELEHDLRPRIVVAFYLAAVKVAFEECARQEIWDAGTVAARVEEAVTLAGRTMRDWV